VLEEHYHDAKPEVQWNIGVGRATNESQEHECQRMHELLYQRVERFFQDCDILVTPAGEEM
jgi:hypothetical protein